MNGRKGTVLLLVLFLPAALLLLLASIGGLRSERNQREDDLNQRRSEDESRWWAATEAELRNRVDNRLDEVQDWPVETDAMERARLQEFEEAFRILNAQGDPQPRQNTVTLVFGPQAQRLYPRLRTTKRTDDVLEDLELFERSRLRGVWKNMAEGQVALDAGLGNMFVDAQIRSDLVALTTYFRAEGHRANRAVAKAVELEMDLFSESLEQLPTTLRLNLLNRLARSASKTDDAQKYAAHLIAEYEGFAESNPLVAAAWRDSLEEDGQAGSQIAKALKLASDRAGFRRAALAAGLFASSASSSGRRAEVVQGLFGISERDETRTIYVFGLNQLIVDSGSMPEGLQVRELGPVDRAEQKLVIPGGAFGARRFDVSWSDVTWPVPWTTIALIAISAIALIGLGFGAWSALRSMERERDLLDTRAEFLAAVSHQLKTPVANLRLFAETLGRDDGPEGEDKQRMLSILRSESEKLGHQLQRIMGVARLDAPPDPQVDRGRVEVGDLVAEVADRWRDRIALKGGSIEVGDLQAGWAVQGNRELLVEALDNLVGNAVEHGAADKPVNIAVEPKGKAFAFLVTDEGPGIPSEDHERVFERFHRGEGERKRRGEGTGLGLWISRRIAKRHHGRLVIAKTSSAGTTMQLELPALKEEGRP